MMKPKAALFVLLGGIVLFSGCIDSSIKDDDFSEDEVEIRGVVDMPHASWSPVLDGECMSPSPIIRDSNKVYYLDGICPFADKLSSKEVIVRGVVEERELDVPLRKERNSPTRKENFTVINVRDIREV